MKRAAIAAVLAAALAVAASPAQARHVVEYGSEPFPNTTPAHGVPSGSPSVFRDAGPPVPPPPVPRPFAGPAAGSTYGPWVPCARIAGGAAIVWCPIGSMYGPLDWWAVHLMARRAFG